MKKVIVTGGAGFIGSNLTALLLKKGYKVFVLDDLSVGKKENLPLKDKRLQFVKANVANRKQMLGLVKNADIVFHLAVQCVRKSIHDPWLVHKVNTEGTLSVLDACLANKIKRFVYVSSSEAYGTAIKVPMSEEHPLNPTTIYGASKLAGELYSQAYLKTYGLDIVIARPFNTYGYNEHFEGPYGEVIPRFVVRAINDLSLQIFGNGKQTRDFTFVEDTARGILLVGEKGKTGEVYNIARGKEVSILQLSGLVLTALGKKVKVEHLSPRPGDVRRHFARTNKSYNRLGFKARYSIEEGVKKYVKWFMEKYPDHKSTLKFYREKNW